MLKPPLPADEAARLHSLHALDILDTVPEERFDRITRLATLAADVPIALVSLVDADRQWFKSCQGLDATETGRDISFCGHAILSAAPFIVEDAALDERFADNPLVTGEPHIRFYAGFPLDDGTGQMLGTLCLIDREPRQLTRPLLELMKELASMVQTELHTIAREEIIAERDTLLRRLEATTEAIDEGLITTGWDGRIVTTNRATETMFGYSRSELAGRPISSLLPENWREAVSGAAMAATGNNTVELPARRRDGTPFTMELSTRMTIHEEDRLAITVVRDVTARKEIEASLRRSEQLHQSVFAAMHEAVMIVDAEGVAIAANESAMSLLADNFDADRPSQHWLEERVRLDGTPIPYEERPLPRTLATGEAVSDCLMGFPQESGDVRWIEMNTQPLFHDGEHLPYAVVLSLHEVTDRVNLDRLKSHFVSMVSHELRTPLTAIQGSLSLLTSGALGEMPPKATRMLEMAHDNTQRLVRLVNDILDLQRMEAGSDELVFGPCNDRSLLDETVELMEPLAHEAGVAVTADAVGVSLVADRDRLLQTLTNLVANAIKFSDAGGRVEVNSRVDDGHVSFSVRDDGRGIPADKRESIFGRFQQVEASDAREKGGTGLGLAICKQIVEQHGGSIRLESELGHGSEFTFTIPVDSAPVGRADDSARPENAPLEEVASQ